jgi:hypothetical protein
MRKIVLTYGLIAGAIMGAMIFIEFPFLDRIEGEIGLVVGYTTMVVAFLMVFFGVKTYRDNVAGGSVGFGRALAVALSISFVASVCYVAAWEVVLHNFAPDFADKYAAHGVAKVKASGASEAQIAAKVQQMEQFKEMYKNPFIVIALTFLEPLPVGLLFSFIAAWRLSRKQPTLRPAAA